MSENSAGQESSISLKGRKLRPEISAAGKIIASGVLAVAGGKAISNHIYPQALDQGSGVHFQTIDKMPSQNLGLEYKIYETPEQLTDKVMSNVPINLKDKARIAIPLIIKASKDANILSKKVLANELATAEYEANFDVASEEYEGEAQADKLKYEGGKEYYARGLGALTHKSNYDKYGKRLGIDLVSHPELALLPENSARILVLFIKDEGIADLIEHDRFEEARKKFVGDYDESDEYNKRITKYITLRTLSYLNSMK